MSPLAVTVGAESSCTPRVEDSEGSEVLAHWGNVVLSRSAVIVAEPVCPKGTLTTAASKTLPAERSSTSMRHEGSKQLRGVRSRSAISSRTIAEPNASTLP